jgi:signal transduction histidine kinase/ligand-binding sensor domain-containing protein
VTRRSTPSRLLPLALLIALAISALPGSSPILALTDAKLLQEYGRQSWQTESGLPQNTVHAILQTRDGFLWLATEGGLVRCDGQDLLTFDTANTPQLHSNLINALAEDDRGNLWIGTVEGLLELAPDPLHPHFTLYTTADGLPANDVQTVQTLRQSSGSLLVLTTGGAALLVSGRLQAIPGLTADISPALVTEAPNGALWIAAGRQIVSFAPGAATVTSVFSAAEIPAAIGALQTIAATAQGSLWVGGHNGLALLSPARSSRGENRALLSRRPLILHPAPSDTITALLPQTDGTLWIGTSAGLARYANGVLRAVPADASQTTSRAITASRVLELFPDRGGALWIAYDLGLARLLPPATFPAAIGAAAASDHSRLQTPISVPGVRSIFEDREGDMWFGTDTAGLTVLREQPFTTLTTADGLSGDFVRAVFQPPAGSTRQKEDRGRSSGQNDPADRIWVGTNRGLDLLREGKLSSIPGLSGSIVLALTETSSRSGRDLWIGTPDGLDRLRDGRLTHFTTADGLPDDFVRSLYTDIDGSLWIGTRNGLAHLDSADLDATSLDPAAFTTFSRQDGLGSDVIGAILRTRSGTLWVGTLGGLSRLSGARFRNYTRSLTGPGGLSGDAITALYEDRQGTLWIAAHAAGLTRLRNGVFTALHASQGSLPEEIFSILEDSGNAEDATSPNLWLGSSRGIYRVLLEALNALADQHFATVPSTVYGTADGLRISECSSGGHPAGWRMQDGSLWFATLKGVASIQPGSGTDNRVPPLSAIEQVLIDSPEGGKPPDSSDGSDSSAAPLTIPPGTEHLTLHYAGLSFAAPQKVHFRYKLEGFDRDWIDAGTRRTAFYTHLPPGHYRFLVYAANNDGLWSLASAALPLTLQPHLYQTRWFRLLGGLALIGLGSLLYRSRLRFLAAQYQAVLNERARIAREIHDTLAQGYVGVSVQLEVASRLLPASPEAAASQLEITKQLVRSSLADARSSIWNLRSPQSSDGTEPDTLPHRLAAAVSNTQQTRRLGDSPSIRLDVRGASHLLDRRLEDELLRIAQEAVTNAVRHAGARRIVVTLSYETGSLRLEVADDGIGFTTPPGGFASTGHFGLKGIEERAAAISAQFLLRSERGQGTTLTILCPLHAAPQHPGQRQRPDLKATQPSSHTAAAPAGHTSTSLPSAPAEPAQAMEKKEAL